MATSESLARLQVMTMVCVVVGFLLATVAAAASARTIDREAFAIADNAMPSVRQLSAARADLHLIDTHFERTLLRKQSPSRVVLDPLRKRLTDEIDAY
jgi:hypothetical protein